MDITTYIKQRERQLTDVQHILRQMHERPAALKILEMQDLVTPEYLYTHYEEWLNTYSLFPPREKNFFNPNWVPLQSEIYDFFINIADPRYPLLNAYFRSSEPHRYFENVMVPSISILLKALDSEEHVQSISDVHFHNMLSFIMEGKNERREMQRRGALLQSPLVFDELMLNEEIPQLMPSGDPHTVVIKNVSALVIGLLDYCSPTAIKLFDFEPMFFDQPLDWSEIGFVDKFIFECRETGYLRIQRYTVDHDTMGTSNFDDGVFTFNCGYVELVEGVRERFGKMCEKK